MFKVVYEYFQKSPSGGNAQFFKKVKIYDAANAKELQEQIDAFLEDDKNGYRTNINIVSVDRL